MGVMSRTKTNRQPSMGDVAAAVGVSKTTISRYLHGNFGYRGVSGVSRWLADWDDDAHNH